YTLCYEPLGKPIMIGQLIGDRYEVIEILGSGNMANTYLTEDLQSDRQRCVVKRLAANHPEPNLLETKRQLFAREAASLEALGANDHIPQLLNYVEMSEECYLVQEFVDGYPLMEEIIAGEQWTSSQVIQLLEELLSLLTYVHGRGFIHRDIKPSNIMRRCSDGHMVLIDFGAATQIAVRQSPFTRKTRANFVVGTPGYMPIEQANGRARPNSDVYALGMIAIQALTGMAPRQLQEDDQGEWAWQNCVVVSEELAAVLAKMVCHQHSQRYQSATEALAAIQSVKQALAGSDRSFPAAPPRPRRASSEPDDMASPDEDSTEVMFPFCVLKAFRPAAPKATIHYSIHFMGASALLLITAFPGIASLMQPRPFSSPEPQLFNPQNLQQVGLYASKHQPLNTTDEDDQELVASAFSFPETSVQRPLE
ncbi:MAG: serine/threonine-protein kinase, partial [Cyanobacteria bacterium J06559_3]